ncbi:MAG: hypothetical protein JXR41_02750 [Bacteroidales bacterium]|nr:hypothetical protein [Bacteroidales bacterium]MBN2761984.1 hypothetical protein [Bacteroidales bacterium]
MKKSVSIVTNYPLDPMHPRTEMIVNLLESMGLEVAIHNPYLKRTFFQNLLIKVTWGYFDPAGAARIRHTLDQAGLVIVQGLTYLPFSKHAFRKGIPVVYETLDNNVHLYYYYLCRRYPILKNITFVLRFFENCEKRYARKYARVTIVNSKALLEYFNDQAELIYYASPLEDITNQDREKAAFLYVGSFEKMKGAFQMLEIAGYYNLPLIVIGTVSEPEVRNAIGRHKNVIHADRIPTSRLKAMIGEYMEQYFLLGLSLTQAVNLSNKTQELNKDIDYLAMGIPIVGNERKPTAEKIEAGCGCYHNDQETIQELIQDRGKRKAMSEHCREYYRKNYSKQIFDEKFRKLLSSCLI